MPLKALLCVWDFTARENLSDCLPVMLGHQSDLT